MPLTWNEIRDRATAFAAEWRHTKDEDADAKSFLDAFKPKLDSDPQRVAFLFGLYKHLTELEEQALA